MCGWFGECLLGWFVEWKWTFQNLRQVPFIIVFICVANWISEFLSNRGKMIIEIMSNFFVGNVFMICLSNIREWSGFRVSRQCVYGRPLLWRHNEHDCVSNHQPHDCLLSRSFRPRSKENTKAPCHWPLCGEFTVDRWIPRTNGQ